MQRAFFSKYKNCQYIDKDGLACINHIFVVVVELCGSVLNAQVVLNVSVLVLCLYLD